MSDELRVVIASIAPVFKLGRNIVVLLCLFTTFSHAQLTITPIGPNQQNRYQNARVAAADTVQIPFFDDFASSKNGILNPKLWKTEGGTYVSNTMTTDHPSVNVVVFDGTDFKGRPYNFESSTAQGYTDTLSSQPIDLGGLKQADAVYLSYYFRREGLGEFPDKGDSIFVQFKNKDGGWDKVWGTDSGKLDSLNLKPGFIFNTIAVPINYLYKGFQFRFRTKGRQSGRFDNWFVDYVYLNSRILKNDKRSNPLGRFYQDVACFQPLSSFLKRYSAMPLTQYLVKPAFETADSLRTAIRNLNNNFNSLNFRLTIKNDITGNILRVDSTTNSPDIKDDITQAKAFKIGSLPPFIGVKKVNLSFQFQIKSTDNNEIKIPGIDFRRNDTVISKMILDNYYAYDDGTAEYAAYLNKPLGRVAIKFVLNKKDTVVGVKINLVPILKDINSQDFTIFVWRNSKDKPGAVAFQKSYKVQYSTNRDQFIDFPFFYEIDTTINNVKVKFPIPQGVVIDDSVFYVGWMQISPDPVAVGLDKNNKRSENIFVNTGQEWVNYTDFKNDPSLVYFDGSLLLRPYLGSSKPLIITATSSVERQGDWKIYPNPTEGIVSWDTDEVKEVQVMTINGSTVMQFFQVADKRINISALPTGQYLIRLANSKRFVVHKVLKL